MTYIHYKFSSLLTSETAVFEAARVTLGDLKKYIMAKGRLRPELSDLQISDAHNGEVYTDENNVIPHGSSVVVMRVSSKAVKSTSSIKTRPTNKIPNKERSRVQHQSSVGTSKTIDVQNSNPTWSFLSKASSMMEEAVSEEDKIKNVMISSGYTLEDFDQKAVTELPKNYICYRCGNPGHHIRDCSTYWQEEDDEAPRKIKRSTGIPRSFMVEVNDPNVKGAMLTSSGSYAVPAIDAEAYAVGKKERPPFLPQEKPTSEVEEEPVPDELICPICDELLSDAVVIPCCGNNYCDECIRTALLDSEDHVCPTCSKPHVSPDTLSANKFLRQAVNSFEKERDHNKKFPTMPVTSSSLNPEPAPVPTTPDPDTQKKPHPSLSNVQDSILTLPKAANTPTLPVVSVGSSAASCLPSTSSQPLEDLVALSDKLPAAAQSLGYPPVPPPIFQAWIPASLPTSPIVSLPYSTPTHVHRKSYEKQRLKRRSKYSSSYSRSSSRSRSPSRSHSRSRSHSGAPSSYSFGYRRPSSSTPSSSSSSTYDSRRRKGRAERKARDSEGSCSADASIQLDTERYLQWMKDYSEWCQKHLNSYVSHYKQLPPFPCSIFPPPAPQPEDRHPRSTQRESRSSSSDSSSSSSSSSQSTNSSSDSRSSHPHSKGDSQSKAFEEKTQTGAHPESAKERQSAEENKLKHKRPDGFSPPKCSSKKLKKRKLSPPKNEHKKRRNKEMPRKILNRVETEKNSPKSIKAPNSIPTRKKEDLERKEGDSSPEVTTIHPESRKSESPEPCRRKKQKQEKKVEKKTSPVTEKGFWEGGMTVKPQKKISININLDIKRKEVNIEQPDPSNVESPTEIREEQPSNKDMMETEAKERKESNIDHQQAVLSEKETKPDETETMQILELFTDSSKEMLGLGEDKDEGNSSMWRSIGSIQREAETTVSTDSMLPRDHSHKGRNTADNDGINSMVVQDCDAEESLERKTVVNTEEESSQNLAADEPDRQHPPSIRQMEDEKKPDEGEARVPPDTPPVVPAETASSRQADEDNDQQRQKSIEVEREQDKLMVTRKDKEEKRNHTVTAPHKTVSPSSGRDRPSSTFSSRRDASRDWQRDRERRREKEWQKPKEQKVEKERKQERERERPRSAFASQQTKKLPSLFHPLFPSPGRQKREQQRGRHSIYKSSSIPQLNLSGFRSSITRRSADSAFPNQHNAPREMSPEWKVLNEYHSHHYSDLRDSLKNYRHQTSRHSFRNERDSLPNESPAESLNSSTTQRKCPSESKVENKDGEPIKVDKKIKNGKCERKSQEAAADQKRGRRQENGDRKQNGETDQQGKRQPENGERPSSSKNSSATQNYERKEKQKECMRRRD